jgi:hypothetical protein
MILYTTINIISLIETNFSDLSGPSGVKGTRFFYGQIDEGLPSFYEIKLRSNIMAEKKTNTDRIKRIYDLCEEHFGDVRFVGIKYQKKIGWVAKAQFDDGFENLTADGETSVEALRNLKNRVKKIIKRYNAV